MDVPGDMYSLGLGYISDDTSQVAFMQCIHRIDYGTMGPGERRVTAGT